MSWHVLAPALRPVRPLWLIKSVCACPLTPFTKTSNTPKLLLSSCVRECVHVRTMDRYVAPSSSPLTLHNHVPFPSAQSLSRGHMPHIESLHDGAVGFSWSYVQRWCTPTRAAIQTGRFPFRNGWNQYGDSMAEELSSIPLSFELLPSVRVLVQSPCMHHTMRNCRLSCFRHAVRVFVQCPAFDDTTQA